MSNENEGGLFSCPVMCWIIGALLAVATYLILAGRFMMGTSMSVIIALVVLAVVGFFLGRLFCRPSVSTHTHPARHDHDIAVSRQSIAAVDSNGAMVSSIPDDTMKTTSAGVAAAASVSAAKSEKPTAKAKPVAKSKPAAKTKKAATKVTAKAKAVAKPKVTAKSKAVTQSAAKKTAIKPAEKALAKKPAKVSAEKAAPKKVAKPARNPVAKDGKPEFLKKARADGADDLKQIKGVGPKLESMMNKMGIYHFDQVSVWRAKEVKWVDENLEGVKGRVSRDEWVKQAKILAKGGQTAFSKKVAKGGVYAKDKK